jgi:hypothetical protein
VFNSSTHILIKCYKPKKRLEEQGVFEGFGLKEGIEVVEVLFIHGTWNDQHVIDLILI